jgi:hypothetical protein
MEEIQAGSGQFPFSRLTKRLSWISSSDNAMVSIGLRLGKCIGELINDRLSSFRRRTRDSPNS